MSEIRVLENLRCRICEEKLREQEQSDAEFSSGFANGKNSSAKGSFTLGSFSLDKTNAKHWLTPNLDLAKQIFDFMNTSKTILKNE